MTPRNAGCTSRHDGTRFSQDYMTLADVYRYPGQHFDFHAHQLTLTATDLNTCRPVFIACSLVR